MSENIPSHDNVCQKITLLVRKMSETKPLVFWSTVWKTHENLGIYPFILKYCLKNSAGKGKKLVKKLESLSQKVNNSGKYPFWGAKMEK